MKRQPLRHLQEIIGVGGFSCRHDQWHPIHSKDNENEEQAKAWSPLGSAAFLYTESCLSFGWRMDHGAGDGCRRVRQQPMREGFHWMEEYKAVVTPFILTIHVDLPSNRMQDESSDTWLSIYSLLLS